MKQIWNTFLEEDLKEAINGVKELEFAGSDGSSKVVLL
jgi:hypothetical protein